MRRVRREKRVLQVREKNRCIFARVLSAMRTRENARAPEREEGEDEGYEDEGRGRGGLIDFNVIRSRWSLRAARTRAAVSDIVAYRRVRLGTIRRCARKRRIEMLERRGKFRVAIGNGRSWQMNRNACRSRSRATYVNARAAP